MTLLFKATAINTVLWLCCSLWYSMYLALLPHPISPPPFPLVPPIPYSLIQLVHPLPTSVCLSACHPRVMHLSQPLGALLTPQHSVFAQSFGSRIRGWIVNYSRSPCAPQPPALSAPPPTCCWLISMAMGQEFVFSHASAANKLPATLHHNRTTLLFILAAS